MSGNHLIETDLREVRERRDYSLDHVQNETRIPLDVLKRFESGDLVGDPTYNDVYVKAFLRSYAKAIGVPQGDVVTAFDAQRAGRYNGELHPDYADAMPPAKSAEDLETVEDAVASLESTAASIPSPPTPAPVQALSTQPPAKIPIPPPPRQPISSKRVKPARAAGQRRSFDKNWGTILGLFSVVVVLLGLAVWALVFRTDTSSNGEILDVAAGAEAAGDSMAVASSAERLALPIEITVTAAGNGLQWFRVSTDGGERSPFWIDQGASQAFTADSSLVLWGEGSAAQPGLAFEDVIVRLQGTTWTPQNGAAVTIDAVNGQRLLDSLATLPQAPRPAPDTP